MKNLRTSALALCLGAIAGALPATTMAQETSPRVAAERAALAPLASFNGHWRGQGWAEVNGMRVERTVTLRVGYALDGVMQVIETRSYNADGSLAFHAFNNVAFEVDQSVYVIQARAEGRFGEFPFQLQADGYQWQLGGGGSGLRYTGSMQNGVWTEVTEALSANSPPREIARFSVTSVGNTDWPAGGALEARASAN